MPSQAFGRYFRSHGSTRWLCNEVEKKTVSRAFHFEFKFLCNQLLFSDFANQNRRSKIGSLGENDKRLQTLLSSQIGAKICHGLDRLAIMLSCFPLSSIHV